MKNCPFDLCSLNWHASLLHFSEALEQLHDNVDDLEVAGAENRDIEFLRQLLEDPSLMKIVDVSVKIVFIIWKLL